MKKLLLILTVLLGYSLKAQPPCNFTLTPPNTPYSITCTNTVVLVNAAPGSFNYTWTSVANPPVNGSTVSFTNVGTYTVTAADPGGACTPTTQVFSIVFNTVAPTTSVNPTSQAITCASNSPVTFSGTCTNPTVNLQHDWYSPLAPLPGGPPIATTNNTLTILAGNIPPGVYTLQTTNLVTGCLTRKTVTVVSLDAYPTFSMSSPTSFSVGCAPLNQTTLSIINPVSTQTPPSTCSFTFLPPGFAGTLAPGPLDPVNSSITTTLAGTWTVVVNDNSNSCRSQLFVSVIQNTTAPHVSAVTSAGYTLMCKTPTILATGTSTTPGTIMTWNVPSQPPTLSTPTVVIGVPANGPPTSTTSLSYANYTVVGSNSVNACQSTSVISILQNFKPPVASAMISLATATAIYCTASVNPVVLSSGSSTTTSGGGPTAFVANPCWQGPSPQTPTCGPSTYSCYVAGVYSLTVEDNYNGCKHTGTVMVTDKTQPPPLTSAVSTSTLDCANNLAPLSIGLNIATNGHRFLITDYPPGTSFSPTNAITVNVNPNLSGTTTNSISVDKIGMYVYRVTSTLTGCVAQGTVNVQTGDLKADFDPSSVAGYAPLTVDFFNNSSSSLGTGSINSIWYFGNGTSRNVNGTGGTSTTYTAAGSYSVTLFVQKGNCLDTAVKVIRVDIPSKMEIPNIFTPNGDGANDVYILRVANLTEITAVFFDRWGNKVYDVNSSTGNILWDGKNLSGKDCPSGVYLYHINAKGKDGTEYKEKGNITLLR